MAHLNKNGEIEISRDDEICLREKVNINVDNLMNWIIWGNPNGFTKNNLIQKHDKN